MSRSWKSYRHRFVPWLAMNWKTRQIKQIDLKSDLVKEEAALTQLCQLLTSLSATHPILTVREWRHLLNHASDLAHLVLEARKKMKTLLGFELKLGVSMIPDGGKGVFVTRDSDTIPQGQLVGLYPGTVYSPFQPIFFQSLCNSFIFRCADGWMIDGNNRSISSWIYKSCAYRDVIGPYLSCDLSWLSTSPINPLSIGQFVNNHSKDVIQNVEYVEVNIPDNFPLNWRSFLPNVHYSSVPIDHAPIDTRGLRMVALMSTKAIYPNEELYSSYFTIVTDNS